MIAGILRRVDRVTSRSAGRRLPALAAVAILLAMPAAARDGMVAPDVRDAKRVVAVGDVHGDHDRFTRLLLRTGVLDSKLEWSGGETVLVQTGDLLDRGPDSRRALELMMRLERDARKAGGHAITLLGNHEVMNLTGDLRYLHPEELAPYAAEESSTEHLRKLEEIEKFLAGPRPLLRSDYYQELLGDWLLIGLEKVFPPGWFRHRELFARDGRYGKWLLGRHALAKVDRSLFLHGGLSPRFGKVSFVELRKRFADDLAAYLDLVDELVELGVFHPALGINELRELIAVETASGKVDPGLAKLFARLRELDRGPVFAADGVIWYRGLAEVPERRLAPRVREILRAQDVDRIVVGHTRPIDHRIRARLGGAVVLIDTGMSREAFAGHAEALEIIEGGRRLWVRSLAR